MAAANGGVTTMVSALVVELAHPGERHLTRRHRCQRLGRSRTREAGVFDKVAASTPARRVGAPSDISMAARALLTDLFITGETLHVDVGGRWA
jgi:NAD(P)-dependent dehydrogenase (short-subunit alcohol dehydrogenase family)